MYFQIIYAQLLWVNQKMLFCPAKSIDNKIQAC